MPLARDQWDFWQVTPPARLDSTEQQMKHVARTVTRTATLDDLRDLLDRPPRAYLAFDDHETIAAAPVTFLFVEGRYLVRPDESVGVCPKPGEPAMLLVDDGHYSLQLRGFRIRGRLAEPSEALAQPIAGTDWLELQPEKVICWDYGSVRRRPSP